MDRSPSPAAVRCYWLLQGPGMNFHSLQVHASLNQRSLKESQMDFEIPDTLTGGWNNFHVLFHILELSSGLSSLFHMLENKVLSGKR